MDTEDSSTDFSQKLSKKKVGVLLVGGVILAAIVGMYYQTKSQSIVNKREDDTYRINADSLMTDNKLLQPDVSHSQELDQPTHEVTEEELALVQEKRNEFQQRLSAPMMIQASTTAVAEPLVAQGQSSVSDDANIRFKNQASSQKIEVSVAEPMGKLNTIIATGSLIHATLESATNSDLPGYLRASVSDPVYSEDGSQVLIARGSRLIGQYKSGMLQGQSRIFIVWTRVITPEGVSVELASSGVDSLGVAGLGADEIDRHFWQRFGTASLLSIIGAGTSNAGGAGTDTQNPASLYREAVANSFAQSANQSIQQDSFVAPTLRTYQGKPIMVFVTRDLHFEAVMHQVKPRINVF